MRDLLQLSGQARETVAVIDHRWVDTFDRRLRRAGVSLQLSWGRSPEGDRAEIAGVDGGSPWSVPCLLPRARRNENGWRLEQLLGEGPATLVLGPLLGGRALLPIARLRARKHSISLRGRRGEALGEALWEERLGAGRVLPRIWLRVTLVGRQRRRAEELRNRLVQAGGLQPSPGGWLAWLDKPGGPRVRPIEAGEPSAEAVRRILRDLREVVSANTPGVLADLDVEFLHDLRVAVRRARSAVKLVGDCLPGAGVARLAVDLRWMGDLTTPTRDMDVLLQALSAAGDTAAEPLLRHLAERRAQGWSRLAAQIQSPRWKTALRRWAAVTQGGTSPSRGGRTVEDLARDRAGRAYRRAFRIATSLTPVSPPEHFHRLRKRCKELRYLLEFFATALDGGEYRELLPVLRSLQDCLGEFQDTQVQEAELLKLASMAATAGPGAVLALGRLDHELRERRERARQAVVPRLEAFTQPRLKRWARAATERGRLGC
jgi:CHAD domain-containing protein